MKSNRLVNTKHLEQLQPSHPSHELIPLKIPPGNWKQVASIAWQELPVKILFAFSPL